MYHRVLTVPYRVSQDQHGLGGGAGGVWPVLERSGGAGSAGPVDGGLLGHLPAHGDDNPRAETYGERAGGGSDCGRRVVEMVTGESEVLGGL